jgi:predicted nucleic acid-binding Zn ribbon protein
MPIYVYETIPRKPGEKPRYFEFLQSLAEEPFTKHPETGERIQRVLLGSFGVLSSRKSSDGAGISSCCSPGSRCCS